MRNNWKEYRLNEVGKIIGGGTPSSKIDEYWNGNISWITPKDLSGYQFRRIKKGGRSITELGLEKSSTRLLPKNTVLITSRAPIGYLAIADKEVCTNQGFKSIILNEGFHPEFIYYLIKNNIRHLEAASSGSTFKEISGSSLGKLIFNFPPYEEQKKIAHLLGTLDDKIELNRQTNQTLEAMAQALFQSWFVNFDPVIDNALQAGNTIPDALQQKAENRKAVIESGKYPKLPQHIQDQFPNSFVYSQTLEKWIPEGWEVGKIEDISKVVGGGTPSKKVSEYFTDDGIAWLTPKDLSGYNWRFISKGKLDITELGLKKSSAKLLPKNSILFSSRAPIGYIALAENEITTNQGFKSLIPNKSFYKEYLFQFLKDNILLIESVATGSTFKEVSGTALKGIDLILPTENILNSFDKITEDKRNQLLKLRKQTNSLKQTRNTLLPQLISGKLSVAELMLNVK